MREIIIHNLETTYKHQAGSLMPPVTHESRKKTLKNKLHHAC